MGWRNLEPTLQSEVSQKEKNRYHVLMHIYGFWKNGADFQGRGRDTDVENEPVATAKQREGIHVYLWLIPVVVRKKPVPHL